MICHRCDADSEPVSAWSPGGIRLVCPKCEAPCGAAVDVAERPGVAKVEPVVRKAEPSRVVVQVDSRDLVESVRARIASIDVELERLDALRTERKRLGAMLRAAERTR